MFSDFFVRTSLKELLEDSKFYLDRELRPELYLRGMDLKLIEKEGIARLAEILAGFDCHTIHAPFFDISLGGFDSDIRDLSFKKLQAVLKLANVLGTKLVVIHYNYDDIYYRENFERWMDNTVDFLSRLLGDCEGTEIALENIAEGSPQIALDLIGRLSNRRVIHCFDVGHFNVFSDISLDAWLGSLRPADSIHFHFHDNEGEFDSHLPVGKGNIDWTELKIIINKYFCNYSVTLEPHSRKDLIKSVENFRKLFIT
jgi:sugar phosphate isomerase/epimerase